MHFVMHLDFPFRWDTCLHIVEMSSKQIVMDHTLNLFDCVTYKDP